MRVSQLRKHLQDKHHINITEETSTFSNFSGLLLFVCECKCNRICVQLTEIQYWDRKIIEDDIAE